jgi:hypothetical protein
MRSAHFLWVSAFLITGCAGTHHPSSSVSGGKDAPITHPVADGWTPSEYVEIKNLGFSSTPILRSRSGVTPSGSKYRYYSDGSGSISKGSLSDALNEWSIDCTRDKMSDNRNCRIVGSQLFVFYGDNSTPQQVCALRHDFPGRTAAIRIDQSVPIATARNGCIPAARVFSRLLNAQRVTVRAYHFPYDYPADAEESLSGFKDAHELVTHIRAKVDKLSFD